MNGEVGIHCDLKSGENGTRLPGRLRTTMYFQDPSARSGDFGVLGLHPFLECLRRPRSRFLEPMLLERYALTDPQRSMGADLFPFHRQFLVAYRY